MKAISSRKQRQTEQLIAALMTHPTIETAARAVGIGEVTAWRWMRDPEFNGRYREGRREALRQNTSRLQEAAAGAVDCLAEIQKSGESESARVSAARAILEHAMRAVDLEDVQQRLDDIERKFNMKETSK